MEKAPIFGGISINVVKDNTIQQKDDACNKIKVTKFIVGTTDLLPEVNHLLRVEEVPADAHSAYAYTIIFERPLQQCVEHKVELSYEYEIPIWDYTQVYRSQLPTKKFSHNIIINGPCADDWVLSVQAFASFFYKGSRFKGDYQVKKLTQQMALISFDDWTLPGTGYLVAFTKKTA